MGVYICVEGDALLLSWVVFIVDVGTEEDVTGFAFCNITSFLNCGIGI